MPKIVNIASKRAELVAASLEVIANEGLPGATLRRIAAHMGVSTGSITHYFDGRDELLLEAVATAHNAAGLRMRSAVGRSANPADRLESVVLEALPLDKVRIREWKVWSAFRATLPGSSVFSKGNELGYGAWKAFLITLLEPLFADPDAIRREAALIMAMVDGIGFRLAAMPDDPLALASEQRQAAADIRVYLRGVSARQPQDQLR